MDYFNMTHSEAFRLNGFLPVWRIEDLLDQAAPMPDLADIEIDAQDAAAGFPSEDCLADIILRIESLARSMRGANRAEIAAIAELVTERQDDLRRSAEYGAEKIKAIRRLCNAA